MPGGISILRVFQPAADCLANLLEARLQAKIFFVGQAARIFCRPDEDFRHVDVHAASFKVRYFFRHARVGGLQDRRHRVDQNRVAFHAERIAFRFRETRLDSGPGKIKFVESMDNRDIYQLDFFRGLSSGGGAQSHRLFDKVISIENLFFAWKIFARGKRLKPDVQLFERHLEDNLFGLHEQLRDGRYRHDAYHAFVVHDPKRRQIHKPTVKDRVVHQAVVNVIEPIFDHRFIYDSYSSRQGKGTHAAVRRLQRFLLEASRGGQRRAYAVKCDVKQFFASVHHQKLLSMLSTVIGDDRILDLLGKIIGSFSASPGRGIPLGNVTSQLFANIYLDEVDQFVKHALKCKRYVRFCDDCVCVDRDRSVLEDYVGAVGHYFNDNLFLELHGRKTVFRSFGQGVDFLGYVCLPYGIVPRTRTKRRLLRRVQDANVDSYLGYLAHAKSWRLRRQIQNTIWLNQNSSSI